MLNRRLHISIRRFVRASVMLSPAAVVIAGAGAHASTPNAQSLAEDNDSTQRASAASATPLCTPLFGTGKAVGVPIAVKDAGGTLITDISSYTFELSDGSQTQDVTAQIKRPEQSQLVTGQSISVRNHVIPPFQNEYNLYSQNASAIGPPLAFTNPGFYFLDCTPDASSSTVKFGPNLTLRMKSAGAVVANVSLTGRGAVYHATNDTPPPQTIYNPSGNTITAVIKPIGSFNGDMNSMYSSYLSTVGIPFRRTFAIEAMMQMSNTYGNASDNSTYCWADLAQTTGSTWSLTQAGEDFVSELTDGLPSATRQLFFDRTRGNGPFLCNLANDFSADEFFMNALAAQLLLIDGPLGNVPQSVSSQNDALRPASVLQLAAQVTTTTVESTTTTTSPVPSTTVSPTIASSTTGSSTTVSPTSVSPRKALPVTGRSSVSEIATALLTLIAGTAIIAARRRFSA